MKAAVLQNWKDMVMTDIGMPVPGPDEALIKVIYGGICGSDLTVYNGNHPTARVPVVLCHEILGTIEKLPDGYAGDFREGERY
jgi:threonine dehydrogenase-like Zn-dependent dehydrogenase